MNPPRDLFEANSEYGASPGRCDYDSNQLCLDLPVEDDLVVLAPVGYESTLTSSSESPTGNPSGSESASETPGTDAASPGHPLAEDAISAAAQATGVPITMLRDALTTVAADVDGDELATAPDYSPSTSTATSEETTSDDDTDDSMTTGEQAVTEETADPYKTRAFEYGAEATQFPFYVREATLEAWQDADDVEVTPALVQDGVKDVSTCRNTVETHNGVETYRVMCPYKRTSQSQYGRFGFCEA